MNNKNFYIIFILFSLFLFTSIFFIIPAQAATTGMPQLQIPSLEVKFSAKVCNPDPTTGKTVCSIAWISEYIGAIYKYAIGVVGILAAVVLMVGGVIWIMAGGSATAIGEAKAWIGAALTGLVIALSSYLILYQVNPALTIFGPLKIGQVEKTTPVVTGLCRWTRWSQITSGLNKCLSGWEESSGACTEQIPSDDGSYVCCCPVAVACGKCQSLTSGLCSVANLQPIFGSYASQASAICNAESSNNNDSCNPKPCGYNNTCSVGLFQINMPYHCKNIGFPGAFPVTGDCTQTGDETQLKNCYDYLMNPQNNINYAFNLFSGDGNKWKQWGSYNHSGATCYGCF